MYVNKNMDENQGDIHLRAVGGLMDSNGDKHAGTSNFLNVDAIVASDAGLVKNLNLTTFFVR